MSKVKSFPCPYCNQIIKSEKDLELSIKELRYLNGDLIAEFKDVACFHCDNPLKDISEDEYEFIMDIWDKEYYENGGIHE